IPAVMTPRDLRGNEICDFFGIPKATYEDLRVKGLEGVYRDADFSEFNELYPHRYKNYLAFLSENSLDHILPSSGEEKYFANTKDIVSWNAVSYSEIKNVEKSIAQMSDKIADLNIAISAMSSLRDSDRNLELERRLSIIERSV